MQADPFENDTGFDLDPRLAGDTRLLVELPLCRLLLMNDARWPWMILVPRRAAIIEIYDLTAADRQSLDAEACSVAKALKTVTGAEKTNVATLGNVVRQFHMHVVARGSGDPNWPGPVWGFGQRQPYEDEAARAFGMRFLTEMERQ